MRNRKPLTQSAQILSRSILASRRTRSRKSSQSNSALREKLKQESQHDLLLGNHHVARAGLSGIAPHLRLREHPYASFFSAFRRPIPALSRSSSRGTLTNRRHVLS